MASRIRKSQRVSQLRQQRPQRSSPASRPRPHPTGGPRPAHRRPNFRGSRKESLLRPGVLRREFEPYMTLSLAGTGRDARVSVAEVNLKFIWDVASQIKVGQRGAAYPVDAQGRLIAHPDFSPVLRNTDMTRLPQVAAARAGVSAGSEQAPIREWSRSRPPRTSSAARCLRHTRRSDKPAIFAPARPGSPARSEIARSTRPYPHLRATIQSPAATLP